MFRERLHQRHPSHAQAVILGIHEGDALLKDFSITGCCLESTMHPDIQLNRTYTVRIIPEKAAKIGPFEIAAEARWIRTGDYVCHIGFYIAASPKGKTFQRFVDYISWRPDAENKSRPDDSEE